MITQCYQWDYHKNSINITLIMAHLISNHKPPTKIWSNYKYHLTCNSNSKLTLNKTNKFNFNLRLLRLIKLSIRLKCAKIGSNMGNADMVRSVNSHMVILKWLTKNLKMKSINLRLVNHSMREASACMAEGACLDMKTEVLKRLLNLNTSLSFKQSNISSRF